MDSFNMLENYDKSLYDHLIATAREDKLVVLDNKSFEKLNETYGKETFRATLSEYIANERPVFPLKEITKDDMRKSFYDLQKFDTSSICIPKEQVEKEVFEKYDDYKYPYSKHGLGLINGPSTYNDVSNYFHQDLRLACGSYGFEAPKKVWEEGTAKDIWKCMGPIWRGINGVQKTIVKDLDGSETEKLIGGQLSEKSYISAFRLGTYIATQFKPVVAKAIYDITNAKTVLDTSCGWGDRLAGFFASDAEEYIGCDPNPNTYKQYLKQVETYNSFLSKPKKVTIYNCGAEDLPWNEIDNIDCAFTSPPYFSTERYNEGGEKEDNQSWKKFDEYSKWRDDFYLPVSQKSFERSKHTFINIMDPTIKGKRYLSCDELVDSLKDNFVGQIGMRIMQRPKSDKLFESEEEKAEFMNRIYIENVWCFSKEKLDYFRHSRRATLF